jgi:hypothetical protein
MQIPDNVTAPFLLFHRSGVTMKLYDLIIASVEKGKKVTVICQHLQIKQVGAPTVPSDFIEVTTENNDLQCHTGVMCSVTLSKYVTFSQFAN